MTRITLLIPLLAVLLSCGQVTQPDNPSQPNASAQVSADVGGSQFTTRPSVAQPPPMVAPPPPPPVAAAIPPPDPGDLLLEEKIIRYNTIVLATMATATPEVVLASDIYRGAVDDRYHVVMKFTFTVHEYLKGSGPANITALWLDGTTYATSAEAESARTAIGQRRDTQWDDERAIIFLVGNHRESVGTFGTKGAQKTLTPTSAGFTAVPGSYTVQNRTQQWYMTIRGTTWRLPDCCWDPLVRSCTGSRPYLTP